jgi:hypothetical protein
MLARKMERWRVTLLPGMLCPEFIPSNTPVSRYGSNLLPLGRAGSLTNIYAGSRLSRIDNGCSMIKYDKHI